MASKFQLVTPFKPQGDQPQAIEKLTAGLNKGVQYQTLLGVTGSGKTFTIANTIVNVGMPAIVLAPNKTLAAQLYHEFKDLFPHNAVEYFVSYYDYYQPEAFIPATNTYIEKDSSINDDIDRLRHSATYSLFEREDVIIVSSVSCIYGLGSPEAYENMVVSLEVGQKISRENLALGLVTILYERDDIDFKRGTFRVRGDRVEVYPPYWDDKAIRIEFFEDEIESISEIDPLRSKVINKRGKVTFYPGTHYVINPDVKKNALASIRAELQVRLKELRSLSKNLEAQRLEQRTLFDIEMIETVGTCKGIENYARYFDGRKEGQAPLTLLDYFPKDFLLVIDESHITVSQIGGMYRGDRARKMTLVEHGFRLISALDNRPLNFDEFTNFMKRTIFVSATPGDYELEKTRGEVIEQIIRPTGLIDPVVEVRPATGQVDDFELEIKKVIAKNERVLITTLTKKMSEDLSKYLTSKNFKVKYLHSDIETLERIEILRDLRLGTFDVLVGINLLREGLDIPETSLIGIFDADKEGFLRSFRSLIQTIGRAARNVNGRVILYADRNTDSMKKAISETERRRIIQTEHNEKHHITPTTIKKKISDSLRPVSKKDIEVMEEIAHNFKSPKEVEEKIEKLTVQMKEAAKNLDFEEAVKLRDDMRRLKRILIE